VPILLFSRALDKGSIGLRPVLSDIGETIAHWLGIAPGKHGSSAL
jgi:phosphopentomutase